MARPKLTDREARRTPTGLALTASEALRLDAIVRERSEAAGRPVSRSEVLREAVLAVLHLDVPTT